MTTTPTFDFGILKIRRAITGFKCSKMSTQNINIANHPDIGDYISEEACFTYYNLTENKGMYFAFYKDPKTGNIQCRDCLDEEPCKGIKFHQLNMVYTTEPQNQMHLSDFTPAYYERQMKREVLQKHNDLKEDGHIYSRRGMCAQTQKRLMHLRLRDAMR